VRFAIMRLLDNLRGTLETNIEEARRLPSRGLDRIVLRPDGMGCAPTWISVIGSGIHCARGIDGGFLIVYSNIG
jgi:hypothetical protein